MFESIIELRDDTFPSGVLILNNGEPWEAFFKWEDRLLSNKRNFDVHSISMLPLQYLEFLHLVSDGAILYYDMKFGQWGYKVYSLKECLAKQSVWRENLLMNTPEDYIAFCELYGDNSILVFENSNADAKIVEANAYLPSSTWTVVADSLEEWIVNLLENKGEKYWEI